MNVLSKPNIVTKIDWMATFRALGIGQSAIINRKEITVANIRTKVSRLKKEGLSFKVQSVDNDDYAIVTREK